MARPITWQDVAAPNLGASLNAAQAASTQIQNALTGIGQVGTQYIADTKEAATRQAVAGILNSADPLAAAAAAPQGWQVDALELQKAALGQDQVNRGNVAQDAQVAASRQSTATNAAQLEDLMSVRRAEAIAQESWEDTRKSGSVKFNSKYEGLEGQDAVKAGAILQSRLNEYHDNLNDDARLKLDRERLGKDKSNQKYLNWEVERGAKPDFQLQDPATARRDSLEAARLFGADLTLVDQGLGLAQNSAVKSPASKEEMKGVVPGLEFKQVDEEGNVTTRAGTYQDLQSDINRKKLQVEREKADAENQFDRAIRGKELMSDNVFAKVPAADLPDQLAAKIDEDVGEAQTRLNKVKAEYPGIDDFQAADIVLATRDRWSSWVNNPAKATEAIAMAGKYQSFNSAGRENGIARELGNISQRYQGQLAGLDMQSINLTGSARSGAPVREDTVKLFDTFRNADLVEKQTAIATAKEKAENAKKVEKKILDTQNQFNRGYPSYLGGGNR